MQDWDAVETAERLRRREVSPREVVESAIARAKEAGPLGAIVTETFERARLECERARGPLAGVPTFIKDLAHVEGVPIGWGTRAVRGVVSRRSDPVIGVFEAMGLVSLGKSATPEFGLTATTEPLAGPPCRNPWDPSRSTGGSSGGAAALVAAGVVPLAHASDGGGSIRIPASSTGLVGLKVTRGRLDMEGSQLLPVNLAVDGVVTRTVRDTVAFWQAVDALKRPRHPVGPVAPAPARRLRVGVYADSPLGRPVHPEVRAAVDRAAALCASLGHEIERIECPVPRAVVDDFLEYWCFVAWAQDRLGPALVHRSFDRSRLEPWTLGLSARASSQPAEVLRATRRLRRFTREHPARTTAHDVLLCPVLAQPPPPLGHLAPDVPFETAIERVLEHCPFTGVFNAIGVPALSLPLGRTETGLPIGIQLVGGRHEEALLLSLALELERAAPWPRIAPARTDDAPRA